MRIKKQNQSHENEAIISGKKALNEISINSRDNHRPNKSDIKMMDYTIKNIISQEPFKELEHSQSGSDALTGKKDNRYKWTLGTAKAFTLGIKSERQRIIRVIDEVDDKRINEICEYITALKKGNCFGNNLKKEVIAWLVNQIQFKDRLKKAISEDKT